jgi:chitodextrinase
MNRWSNPRLIRFVRALLVLIAADGSLAAAPADRTPPTQPTDLRVTATTSYSVSLTWNPSTDKSGQFSYVICCANTSSQTAAQTATSAVYTAGLEAGRSFTLRIYAVDAAGNYSKPSNAVTVTLPADSIPPTQPVVSAKDIGTSYATLAWSSTDNGPNVWYWVSMDGNLVLQGTRDGSASITPLAAASTHTFTVRARDFGGNWSPISEPLTVTTKAPNPNDHTAPTTPANLSGGGVNDGSAEIDLTWNQSTDDLDPQWVIRYNVYVDGVLTDVVVGSGRSIIYGHFGSNTVSVEAVDSAGNTSAAATMIVVI